jgi:cytochrome c oxidase subunit IV
MSEQITPRTYYKVFAALMVLLVLTVAAAFIPRSWGLGRIGIVIAFAIAIVKATLVVLYFMHIKGSSRLTRVFVVAGLAWLAILMSITIIEYHSRPWLTGNAPMTIEPQLR